MSQGEIDKDSHKKEGLDVQLESSFQSSFRSTSTHLKIYDPAGGAEAALHQPLGSPTDHDSYPRETGARGVELVNSNVGENHNLTKQNARGGSRGIQVEPPAGRHAPHHSWLLGSHGGKRKPQSVRTRDGITAKSAIDSATLAGLFSSSSPQAASAGPTPDAPPPAVPNALPPATPGAANPSAPIGSHPDDYRIPANAKGAQPQDDYDEPDLFDPTIELAKPVIHEESEPDLYAPTVEVNNPAAQVGANQSLAEEEDYFDETVAHLYSATVDVAKPGKLTRFPEDSLSPSNALTAPLEAKFGTTSPPAASAGNPPGGAPHPVASQPFTVQGAPPSGATIQGPGQGQVPAGQPPKLPPPRPLSQFQSGISHPQYQSGISHPQFQSSSSNPAMPPKLPPNLPPQPVPGQLQTDQAYPTPKPQAGKPQSNQSGWSPHFDSGAPEANSSSDSASASFPIVKKTASNEIAPRNRKRAQKSSSLQEEHETPGDNETRGPRKRGLPSYIDRQISSSEEEDSADDEDQKNKKRSFAGGKAIGIAVAAIVALAAVGAVVYQGINSGGSSWIPGTSNNEWKEWNTKAEAAMSDGKFEEAIESLNKAIKLNGGQAVLYHQRGLAKFQLHKRDQNESALKDLDHALKQDPKLFEAILDRAAVRIELGQFEQAIEDYDSLIKSGKDTDKVRYGRGLAKYYAGEYAEAEREFRLILKDNPDNSEAAIALGTTLHKSGPDMKVAEEQFANAARHDKSGLANRNLGIMSYETGTAGYQAAKKFYNDAIDDNSTDANLYNERGVISWLLKNPLDATTDFRHAVGLDPNLESAVRNLEFVRTSSMDVDPKSEAALSSQIEINLLKKNWAFAVINADKLTEVAGWKRARAYDGVLLKWVALNLDGKTDKSQEVLRDCKLNAGGFAWPMPLVRYLAADDGKGDFAKLEGEALTVSQRTAVHYYVGMNDYFKGNLDEAKKKLHWVLEQGAPSNLEYPLAGVALELIADGSTSNKAGGEK